MTRNNGSEQQGEVEPRAEEQRGVNWPLVKRVGAGAVALTLVVGGAVFAYTHRHAGEPVGGSSGAPDIENLGTPAWVSENTIRIGTDATLLDVDTTDDNMDFKAGDGTGCTTTIDGFNGGPDDPDTDLSQARLTYSERDPLTGECKTVEVDIRIADVANAHISAEELWDEVPVPTA